MQKLILFIATGFGTGLTPKAPGTVGSLVGLLFALLTMAFPFWVKLVCALVLFVISVWASEHACRIYQKKDDQRIVIDEVIGQYITLLSVSTWPMALLGFGLFRLFDIVKFFPADWIDKNMKNGLGVVLDDVVSGYMAWAVLMLIAYVGNQL